MALTIFDLDNTLLAGDSDYLWGQYLVDKKIVDAHEYERQNQRFYREYREGSLDILEFLFFSLKPLADYSQEQLHAWRQDFLDTIIRPIITRDAVSLVEKHRRCGDTLLVITATNRFVTEPIVECFGIENLLATEPERDHSGYTGRVTGVPCFQKGKVIRLNEWLEKTGHHLQDATFYSDSHNDLPLLNAIEHPIAVDPDHKLRAHAIASGWPVISLRGRGYLEKL